MYCPHCGKQNDDTVSFCSSCGKPLNAGTQQPQAASSYAARKSSGIAVVLSFFWMGLGQLYNGQIGKGILLMFLEPVLIIFGFFTLIFLIGFPILLGAFVLWVWNLYDAYNTAERLNRGEIKV